MPNQLPRPVAGSLEHVFEIAGDKIVSLEVR